METFTVRQLRHYLGYTIPVMAKKMEMHPNTYRNKELGKSQWTFKESAKLLQIGGIEADRVKF